MEPEIRAALNKSRDHKLPIITNKKEAHEDLTYGEASNIVANYTGGANKIVNVDIDNITQTIQPQECIHHNYMHGLRLLIVSQDARPEEIFTVDLKKNVSICKICGKTIDCGHVGYMAFMLAGSEETLKSDEFKVMRTRYYYVDGNSQPRCSVCGKVISIESTDRNPMRLILGIINFAEENKVEISYATFESMAIFTLNQLKMSNFKGMIDARRGAPYLTALALSYYPQIPNSIERLQEYFANIGILMFAIVGWYHLNYGFVDNYDILAMSATTKEDVAQGFEEAIATNFQIRRIFDKITNIKKIIAAKIMDVNHTATERLAAMVIDIFHIINRGKEMTYVPKIQKPRNVKRGVFPMLSRPDDKYVAPIIPLQPRGLNVAIGKDGHTHLFIGGKCKSCSISWKDAQLGKIDEEMWDHACAFQEYNHHRCIDGTVHNIKDGFCTVCHRRPDMPIEEIYGNKSILDKFKKEVVNLGTSQQVSRTLVDIEEPPDVGKYDKGHFLSSYIEKSKGEEYFNIDKGESIAICNAISAMANSVLYILADHKLLKEKVRQIHSKLNMYYVSTNLNMMYDKHKDQLLSWFLHFLDYIAVNVKMTPQQKNMISTTLTKQSEYMCINMYLRAQEGFNIIELLRKYQYTQEMMTLEEPAETDEIALVDIGDDVTEILPSADNDIEIIHSEELLADGEDVINHDSEDRGDADFVPDEL